MVDSDDKKREKSDIQTFIDSLRPDTVIPRQPDGSWECCDEKFWSPLDLWRHGHHVHGKQ